MSVSRRLRFEILRRDDHTCRYCGQRAPEVPLTVDHVKPLALGGSDDPSNLVTSCVPCNSGKSSIAPDSPLVADVKADALRWMKAIGFVTDLLEAKIEMKNEIVDRFDASWSRWHWAPHFENEPLPRDADWGESVVRFAGLGLSHLVLDDLMDVAMRKNLGADTWRYFCGCCWRTLDQLHEEAADLLASVDVDVLLDAHEGTRP